MTTFAYYCVFWSTFQALIHKYGKEAALAADEAKKFREKKKREIDEKVERLKSERRKKEQKGCGIFIRHHCFLLDLILHFCKFFCVCVL